MMVVVRPLAAVTQADPKAIPPKAPATRTPANISFEFILIMVILLPQLVIAVRSRRPERPVVARDGNRM